MKLTHNTIAVIVLVSSVGFASAQEFIALGTSPNGWYATSRQTAEADAFNSVTECGDGPCESVFGPKTNGCYATAHAAEELSKYFVAEGMDLRNSYFNAIQACVDTMGNCTLGPFICHSTAQVQSDAIFELWYLNPSRFSNYVQYGLSPVTLRELQTCASQHAQDLISSVPEPIPWPKTAPNPSSGALADLAKWHFDFAALSNDSPMPSSNLGLRMMVQVGMKESTWFPCSTGK